MNQHSWHELTVSTFRTNSPVRSALLFPSEKIFFCLHLESSHLFILQLKWTGIPQMEWHTWSHRLMKAGAVHNEFQLLLWLPLLQETLVIPLWPCLYLCVFPGCAVPLHTSVLLEPSSRSSAFLPVLSAYRVKINLPTTSLSSHPSLDQESLNDNYSFLNQIQTPLPHCQILQKPAPAYTHTHLSLFPALPSTPAVAPSPMPALCPAVIYFSPLAFFNVRLVSPLP